MEFGVWIPNCRHLATPGIIRATAVRAEQLGYDSVWVSDHVITPNANVANFGEAIFDPFVTLAVAAGATGRVKLGTTVLIIPYRNAVVTAKMVSSLDVLSGGRVIFGVGVGGEFPGEFQASGVAVNERAQMLWQDDTAAPNIFAAGEIMAGNVLGKGYIAGIGMAIGTAFGRIAGREAARHVAG